jgi:HSP20 family molecular chaperone IbpA
MALSTFWDTDIDPFWPDRWGDRVFDRYISEPDWRTGGRPLLDWDRPLARRRGPEITSTLRPKSVLTPSRPSLASNILHRMDLHENPESNTVTVLFELPGLDRENVNITVQNGRLDVSGESRLAQQYESGGFAVRERQAGRFYRSVQLPAGVSVRIVTQCPVFRRVINGHRNRTLKPTWRMAS